MITTPEWHMDTHIIIYLVANILARYSQAKVMLLHCTDNYLNFEVLQVDAKVCRWSSDHIP
jgi:hypothetical protein